MVGQSMKVLLVGPVRTPSFIIGVLQPMQYLSQQGLIEFKAENERDVSRGSIEKCDFVIFSRTTKPKSYELLQWAQSINKKTVYVIDDHFLAVPGSTAVGQKFKDETLRETYINFFTTSKKEIYD